MPCSFLRRVRVPRDCLRSDGPRESIHVRLVRELHVGQRIECMRDSVSNRDYYLRHVVPCHDDLDSDSSCDCRDPFTPPSCCPPLALVCGGIHARSCSFDFAACSFDFSDVRGRG